MIDLAALSAPAQAGVLVGAVLVEAVVLYAGYGAVEKVLTPPLIETIQDA